MNTDVDLENDLVQLAVEELVRAGLRTPLREPILAAVERTPDGPVEVVVPEGGGDAAFADVSDDATDDAESTSGDTEPDSEAESSERGAVGKAARGLLVSAVTFTVLYLALRRLSD